MGIYYMLAWLVSWPMRWTGFRFSREYRHAESGWRSWVYCCMSTVAANYMADGDIPRAQRWWIR